MSPGREMDREVAAGVMGYCWTCPEDLSQRSIGGDPEADRIIKEKCRYGSVVYIGEDGDVDENVIGDLMWWRVSGTKEDVLVTVVQFDDFDDTDPRTRLQRSRGPSMGGVQLLATGRG